jgi:CubicO group peptidase (beta-lactamase class C family)
MAADKITSDNWNFPPFNRLSFQHVQSLFPTARIRRGAGSITEFDENPCDLADIPYIGMDGSNRTVKQMLDGSYTDSFLVVKNGTIVCEQYFNGMAADSHHLLNSVTKSFIGMLVGIMAEQGCLQEDDPVVRHMPELSGTAFSRTTIRHALDMTAAVEYGEDYADQNADFWVETAVVGWRPDLVNDGSALSLLDYAKSLQKREQLDGEKYHYRTVLTNVLGMVLERASGRTLQDLLQTEIWSRLGPEQDASIVVDRMGFPYVGAGMNACARDLARFGQMVVQRGFFNGDQIVPGDWVDDTRYGNTQTKLAFAAGEYGESLPGAHYRNQFWGMDSDRGIVAAIGIHGQTIYMDMGTGVVIVKFSSQPESVNQEMFMDTFTAMFAISETV